MTTTPTEARCPSCATPTPTPSSARHFGQVCDILAKHANDPAKIIPILQEVQSAYRYLPEEVMTYIATALGISPARVYGVATFYSHFALEPKGKYVLRICDGTACHVKGSENLIKALRTHLRLPSGKDNTADMLFTIESVSCVGACGLAPVLMVNEDVHGQLNSDKAVTIVKAVQAGEASGTTPAEATAQAANGEGVHS